MMRRTVTREKRDKKKRIALCVWAPPLSLSLSLSPPLSPSLSPFFSSLFVFSFSLLTPPLFFSLDVRPTRFETTSPTLQRVAPRLAFPVPPDKKKGAKE